MEDDDEIPSNFFISEEYVLTSEKIHSFTQDFFILPAASTDYDLTGQVLWPGAKHLAEYLLVTNPALIQDQEVLEVGSGSGLCGLFVSQLANHSILTDGNEIVMRLLEKNKPLGRNIDVALVDWGSNDLTQDLTRQNLPTQYNLIIGADVVFWSNSIVPLFNTIQILLRPNGKFLMCYTLRAMNIYRDLLRLSLEQGFKHEVLLQKEDTYIFEFTRIN